MKRIHERDCVWQLEQYQLLPAVHKLSSAIRAAWVVDIVVGVARGGVVPAQLIAADLNKPWLVVHALSNTSDDILSPARDYVLVEPSDISKIPAGQRVLLVDDICGSGKTLIEVTSRIGTISEEIHCVTLCRNEGSEIKPDLWIWTVRDWVVFPWESNEDLNDQLKVRRLPEATEVNKAET